MSERNYQENMDDVLKKLFHAVLDGDLEDMKINVQASLDAKLDPILIDSNLHRSRIVAGLHTGTRGSLLRLIANI